MHISLIAIAALIPFVILIAFFKRFLKKKINLTLDFSLSDAVKTRSKIANLPTIFSYLSFAFFLFAFINPHLVLQNKNAFPTTIPTKGNAIYFVLDQSGSMNQEVLAKTKPGRRLYQKKIDILKEVTHTFIQNRPNDLIGIVAFARKAFALTPLTLEHQDIIEELQRLKTVQNPNDEGTAIGYALFKTVNLIEATNQFAKKNQGYSIQDAVIILVTDGFQEINPLDEGKKWRTIGLIESAEFAKKHHIKLYLINVEPSILKEKFTPHRKLLEKVATMTGGQFYTADNPEALNQVYEKINQLEKTPLPEVIITTTKISFYPYLIAIGMTCLITSILLQTTLIRTTP